ncbi:vacuolar protein sorting-associated protein 35B-like [Gossypium australe]|uniref:Vacuolar protein sorting-associated protein 35B-like n=1 Tax=Gossypium australe TaxID=47621 RepID=A0A5B6WS70_9ROSI|nr:vacuolar protein sorting-associated protein 35B-like [Gossypium australe]
MSSKAPATSIASVGNVKSELNDKACFRYGSLDHFIYDCPESVEQETAQNPRSDNAPARGRLF